MPTLDLTGSSNQHQYQVLIECSLIYECALDIAAITWDEIHDKLERPTAEIQSIKKRLSDGLQREVEIAGRVHTWRSILFLAHRCKDLHTTPIHSHIKVFVEWLDALDDNILQLAAPYLGPHNEDLLKKALRGDNDSQRTLLASTIQNPLVHHHLAYLYNVSSNELKRHVKALLSGWVEEVLTDVEAVVRSLTWDRDEKRQLSSQLSPPELIQRITRGSDLKPDPYTAKIWLIPQICYRPFTILNNLQDCAIYYYPVADQNLPGEQEASVLAKLSSLHKALGDPYRLKLLKYLRYNERTLAELCEHLQISKSTTHHHLTLLRTADLVSVTSGMYRMNLECIRQYHVPLLEYLAIDITEESGGKGGKKH
jgi:DNA-binding transcriptional ArsR family regulator